MSKTFYIAGPMRGIPEFNFPAFFAAEEKGKTLGYNIISPARMDQEAGLDVAGADGDETKLPGWGGNINQDVFIERDYAAIMSLSVENGDGLAMLPGWENSKGATAERALALWRGLTVVDAMTFEPFPPKHIGSTKFHALLAKIGALHDRKQYDYGRATDPFANVRASEDFGIKPWIGALLRLNDKVRRLQTFARRGTLANESAKDSMLDIAVYALIAYVLYEEEAGE